VCKAGVPGGTAWRSCHVVAAVIKQALPCSDRCCSFP